MDGCPDCASRAALPERTPLVYVIGHYRGPAGADAHYSTIERNTMLALDASAKLNEAGIFTLVPHIQSMLTDPGNLLGDRYWLDCTAAMLRGCTHAVWISRGTEGTESELEICRATGIRVFDSIEDCIAALGKRGGADG